MSKAKFPQKELYERMNFLYQAANVTMAANPWNSAVTNDCCHQLSAISRRAVLKLDPTIKRAMCKKCNALMIPGITATVRIHSKPITHLVSTCLQCKSRKRLECRRGYTLWSERREAIVEDHPPTENDDDGTIPKAFEAIKEKQPKSHLSVDRQPVVSVYDNAAAKFSVTGENY